jgi:galactokinase
MPHVARAPGRVNLIGEHTDHALGLVLPLAIDREIRVIYTPRNDGLVEMRSSARPSETDTFDPADPPPVPPGDWRGYVRGVAALLAERGLLLRGIDGMIESDLPEGGGLSSSAALEVAVALALLDASRTSLPRADIATLCREAEHRFAGVHCGIMDQTAVVFGRRDAALRIDCGTGEVRPVPLGPRPFDIVVIDTGVRRALADSPYNDRVRECREAMAATEGARLSDTLARRRRHVASENARVDAAVDALEAGDLVELGRLLDESHASLRDDFEVSWPEAERAVETAREAGALGARMLGGGFGGSVLAIFREGDGPRHTMRPGTHLLHPAPGAGVNLGDVSPS